MAVVKRILITGATGNIGGQVLSQLPSTGVQVRALVRNPDAARLPAHVEVVYGDLTRPETLDKCLDAIDTVFLVVGRRSGSCCSCFRTGREARSAHRIPLRPAQNRTSAVPTA